MLGLREPSLLFVGPDSIFRCGEDRKQNEERGAGEKKPFDLQSKHHFYFFVNLISLRVKCFCGVVLQIENSAETRGALKTHGGGAHRD